MTRADRRAPRSPDGSDQGASHEIGERGRIRGGRVIQGGSHSPLAEWLMDRDASQSGPMSRDAVAFVARASLFERPARCLREACQIGGEERVVEVDGSVVPSDLAGHRRSALVIGRQGRPEAPLELLHV